MKHRHLEICIVFVWKYIQCQHLHSTCWYVWDTKKLFQTLNTHKLAYWSRIRFWEVIGRVLGLCTLLKSHRNLVLSTRRTLPKMTKKKTFWRIINIKLIGFKWLLNLQTFYSRCWSLDWIQISLLNIITCEKVVEVCSIQWITIQVPNNQPIKHNNNLKSSNKLTWTF